MIRPIVLGLSAALLLAAGVAQAADDAAKDWCAVDSDNLVPVCTKDGGGAAELSAAREPRALTAI